MAERNTTTIRVSRRTKARLDSVSTLCGLNNISKTLDFAVEAAEEKLDRYQGNIESLFQFKGARSNYKNTSENVDKILTKAFEKPRK